jgi:hypothetical protein
MRNMMSMFEQDFRDVLQSPVLVLLALTGDEVEFEVSHQEPSSWEYPFRTLVVLSSVTWMWIAGVLTFHPFARA